LSSARFQRLANEGAHAQRLLYASTGTKDPKASDTLYIQALAAPYTVNTMPENTLLAFADHGKVTGALTPDGGDYQRVVENFKKAGVDLDALAIKPQQEGADSFVKSWDDLIGCIEAKLTELRKG